MSLIKNNKAALLLLVVGVAFLAIGVWRGEVEIKFRKAVPYFENEVL